jgi:hypothetical protein
VGVEAGAGAGLPAERTPATTPRTVRPPAIATTISARCVLGPAGR